MVLNDIEEDQGIYKLKGPYAQIVDANGDYNNNSSNFSATRDEDLFDAVMCYYYIDKTSGYLDDNFGIDIIYPADNYSIDISKLSAGVYILLAKKRNDLIEYSTKFIIF